MKSRITIKMSLCKNFRSLFFLSGLSLLCSPGCKPPPAGPLDDLPSMEGLHPSREKTPDGAAPFAGEVSISHILVTYSGAYSPQVRTNRDYKQALQRAERLTELARTKEMAFDDLARRFSDDVRTGSTGGDLGVISHGQLHPALEKVAFSLGLGKVSDPVHTPTGYHVILRHEPTEAQVSEIVISYLDAQRYTPRTPRSRERAMQLANEIHDRLEAGAGFEDEAMRFSDLPNYDKGGIFPIFKKGSQLEKFEEIVWALPVGGLSEVVETPTGFHIVKRWPVRRINLRVMKFPYRTVALEDLVEYVPDRNEALQNAEKFLVEATRPDADFVQLVARTLNYNTKGQGTRQQNLGRGTMPLNVERAVFALEIGQITKILEADSAFYIAKRVP